MEKNKIMAYLKVVGDFVSLERNGENAKKLLALVPDDIIQNAEGYQIQGDNWHALTFLLEDWAFDLQGNIENDNLDILIDEIGMHFNQSKDGVMMKGNKALSILHQKALNKAVECYF